MGGKASKKRSAGSLTQQSGVAPKVEPLGSGDQSQAGQSTKPERVDSNTHGDYTESSEASTQTEPKKVVKASNAHEEAAVITATEKKTPCEPHDGEEMIESSDGLALREIFVQYIPGKPHALTEFGALLYSRQGGHEFRDLDGTGLARTVGLRNHDELISINNPQSDISSANQLAVLECFSDIGTQIGLVIKRKQEETWLFAFHLNEKGNRPVVENIHSVILDNSRTPVIPVESAFRVNPVYAYDSSLQVQMILEKEDRFMEIDTDKATYVLPTKTVTLNKYRQIYGSDDGSPVSISTPVSSASDSDNGSDSECGKDEKSICIEAVGVGPLKVVAFPRYMTRRGLEIPQNNKFFIHYFIDHGASAFKAANTEKDLSISTDEDYDRLWVASLRATLTKFSIVNGDNILRTREDFVKLFKARDC